MLNPPFSPLSKEEARCVIEERLANSVKPEQNSRWCLRTLLETCKDVVHLKTAMGLLKALRKLGITRQKARSYVHSPDTQYADKLAYIEQVISECVKSEGQKVVVFMDELTYYNHPSLAADYAPQKQQPKAARAIGAEKTYRIAGCLNALTGQVTAIQRSKIDVGNIVMLFQDLVKAYPQAQTIYVIMDNWPVHYHPDVLSALQSNQLSPFAFPTPKSWKDLKPKKKFLNLNLPIQIVSLPTYASWLNPIEKLWKLFKKDFIHNHKYAHCFKELTEIIQQHLLNLQMPNFHLRQYCGLLNKEGIFAKCLNIVI